MPRYTGAAFMVTQLATGAAAQGRESVRPSMPPASVPSDTTGSPRLMPISMRLLGSLDFREFAVASDTLVVAGVRDGALLMYDLATGAEPLAVSGRDASLPTPSGQAAAVRPAISNDGANVAFVWLAGDSTLQLRTTARDSSGRLKTQTIVNDSTLALIEPLTWSPDARTIAVLLQRRGEEPELVLVNASDGSRFSVRSVLADPAASNLPRAVFSRDGRRLAFDVMSGSHGDIHILSLSDMREVVVQAHPADDRVIGWSPDGRLLVFQSDRSGVAGVWSVECDALTCRDARAVAPDGVGARDAVFLRMSSTGGIVYHTAAPIASDIRVASIDFSTGILLHRPLEVAERSFGRNSNAAWSVDGRLLAWQSDRTGSGGGRVICIRDFLSGGVRELRPRVAARGAMLWSPDARQLAVVGDGDRGSGLYRMSVDDGATSFVMPVDADARLLQWTPDALIHFIDASGANRIDATAGGARRFVKQPYAELRDSTTLPAISRDGAHLYYVQNGKSRDSTRSIVVHAIATGQMRTLMSSTEEIRGLFLSPNGASLAVTTGDAAVLVVSANGDARRIRVQDKAGCVAWSPDSRSFLAVLHAADGSDALWWFPVDGGAGHSVGGDARRYGTRCVSAGVDGRIYIVEEDAPPRAGEQLWLLQLSGAGHR